MVKIIIVQKMQIKYVGIWMVVFLVHCGILGIAALEDKDVIKGLLVSGFRPPGLDVQNSDETLVKTLRNNCRHELLNLKRTYIDKKTTHDEASSDKNVEKFFASLNPRIKQSLYKCLREKVRRQLDEAPSGSKKSPPAEDTLIIPIPVPNASPELDVNADSGGEEQHGDGGHTTIIIAIVVTAVATFVIATILFICCRKAFGSGSGLDHKDDRPLLSLSMSNYSSSDSSSKVWSYEKSCDKGKNGNQSFSSNHADSIGVVSSGDNAATDATSVRLSTDTINGSNENAPPTVLPPPPGRLSTSGLPPLKPPPGRTDLLPPEPLPVSSSTPASVAGPSPSPPPPPPPPEAPAAPPPPPPPKKAGPKPPGPPPPPGKPGPRALPPPKGGAPPRPPPGKPGSSSDDADADANSKAKLKPFFWDKVMANPDHSMVWDQIKSGSFQFNEEMIESLFGYVAAENKNEKKKDSSTDPPPPLFIQLIDQKKAQNLSILLRALNVTIDEVRDALEEGNELPSELLETLLKMAPTAEEELKLRLFTGEMSQLGPAERFLKAMVDIPFAFKRIEVLLFMGTLQEESTSVKHNLETLEAACKELRNSRLFLKLLEAVLKTGNRMNDGTYRGGAQAFKLDTLLKLSDVKGTDGKTTLLHFVVQEIVRSEGMRAARASRDSNSMSSMTSIKSEDLWEDVNDDTEEHFRNLGLQVVSGVGDQLNNVKKAAGLDSDSVTGTIAKLGSSLLKSKNFLNKEMDEMNNDDNGFYKALKSFIEHAEGDVVHLLEEEKRIMALVKSTTDYFHGNSGKEEGLRLFIIVRDFLIMLDKVCREVKARPKWPSRTQKKEPPSRQTSSETPRTPFSPDLRQKLFPAIAEQRRTNNGSSSDED